MLDSDTANLALSNYTKVVKCDSAGAVDLNAWKYKQAMELLVVPVLALSQTVLNVRNNPRD